MTKQEVIAKAYGPHYETVKDFLNVDGLIPFNKYKKYLSDFTEMVAFDAKGIYWYPKSLIGIQDNNGWIKIESEDDLPFTNGLTKEFFFFTKSGHITTNSWNNTMIYKRKEYPKIYTHYQPIVKPEPPIY